MQIKLRKTFAILAATGMLGLMGASAAVAADEKATVALASAATPGFSLQTPIEQLMENPAARDAVERVLPGLANHRRYEEFKSMSLDELAPMAPNLLTQDRLSRVAEELAQLGKSK